MTEVATKKAVIFDRDGTLIIDKVYLNDPDQVEFLPGAFEALSLLKQAGFCFCVATNQSGIPRGLVTLENLHLIHERMQLALKPRGLEMLSYHFAPYMTDSDHFMRKPNPGMLIEAQERWGFNLKQSWMIGDRLSDVEAGHRAGCRSVLLSPAIEKTQKNATISGTSIEVVCSSLLEAAHQIIALGAAE